MREQTQKEDIDLDEVLESSIEEALSSKRDEVPGDKENDIGER